MSDLDYGYPLALTTAGATVHAFKEFGSYQGDWWAKITYNGITGWIHDYYGSCSGCDAFEAEIGWRDEDRTPEKLAAFGKQYLEDTIYTQEQAEEMAAKNTGWDIDAEEMLKWIKENA